MQHPEPELDNHEASEQPSDRLKPTTETTRLAIEVTQAYFRVSSPMPYATGPSEPGFSGDAASLFMLVQDVEHPPQLAKVGWGEYSLPVMQGVASKYPEHSRRLQDSGFPLYVVPQDDSYFADMPLQSQMAADPAGYLSERAILFAHGREAYINNAANRYTKYGLDPGFPAGTPNHPLSPEDLQPISSAEVLARSRNLLVQTVGDPHEFGEWLVHLPEDPAELGRLYANADGQDPDWKKWSNLTHDLGVNQVGIAVGAPEAMESVLRLIAAFDAGNNQFK